MSGLSHEEWAMIRHLLAVRSGDRCEATGTRNAFGRRFVVHHRRHRGLGGTRVPWIHDLGNLLYVTETVHLAIHSQDFAARTCGLSVPHDTAVPWDVPITLWGGRRVLLDQHHPCYHLGPATPIDPSWAEPFTAT